MFFEAVFFFSGFYFPISHLLLDPPSSPFFSSYLLKPSSCRWCNQPYHDRVMKLHNILLCRSSLWLDILISFASDDSAPSHTSSPSHHSQASFPDWLLFLSLTGASSRRLTSWFSSVLSHASPWHLHLISKLQNTTLRWATSKSSLEHQPLIQALFQLPRCLIKFSHEFFSCTSHFLCPNLDFAPIWQLFMFLFWHTHRFLHHSYLEHCITDCKLLGTIIVII